MKPKLIGIGYQKQVGKDTAAEIICELLKPATCLIFHFADALKQEVSDALGVSVAELNENKKLYRPLLQWWGTEYRRGQDPHYWTLKMQEQLDFYKSDYKIIADVRFLNEGNFVKNNDGILVLITNIKSENNFDSHRSETEGKYLCWDLHISNSGSIDLLKSNCKEFVNYFLS